MVVEVLNPAGMVVDTLDLGAQGAGRHGFDWNAGTWPTPPATASASAPASAPPRSTNTPLMLDRVQAVASGSDGLTLDLERSGSLPYTEVRAFN